MNTFCLIGVRLLTAILIISAIASCKKAEQPMINQDQGALTTANNKIQELSAQIDQLRINS